MSTPITSDAMRSLGFKQILYADVVAWWIGPPEARLYVIRGYSGKNYWACIAKYQEKLEHVARNSAHFPRRYTTEEEIVQLVTILGYLKPAKRKRKS